MAENEAADRGSTADDSSQTEDSATAVADGGEEAEFVYSVKVEDAGPAIKKVSVEIPEERIKSKLAKQLKDLRRDASIPGFRQGRAPVKLIERRFGTDIKEQVRRDLISESYGQAVEKNNLQVLGDPEFKEAEKITLPESGPLNYTFEVEVQPEMTLPELTGIAVRKPKIQIKDENVEQAMTNLRQQQGALVPVEDRGIEDGDYLTADVHLKVDGNVVTHQHDASLVARPGGIAGIEIADLAQQLAGAKVAETRSINVKVPDNFREEAARGKDAQVEITIKDIKRLELAEITPDFLTDLGFENEQELRDALREQMVERIDFDIAQAQRQQVSDYLLANTAIDLPAKLSAKQSDRVVQRRAMDLLQRGMPREQIAASIEQLRGGAAQEAQRELKLFFILQKIAADQGVDIDEAELNGRIAMLAAQREERPEKLKQDMSKDGSLQNLYIQMREQKALDKVLESAKVEEVEVGPGGGGAEAAPAGAAPAGEAPAAETPAAETPAAENT
jgi:trigger factor